MLRCSYGAVDRVLAGPAPKRVPCTEPRAEGSIYCVRCREEALARVAAVYQCSPATLPAIRSIGDDEDELADVCAP